MLAGQALPDKSLLSSAPKYMKNNRMKTKPLTKIAIICCAVGILSAASVQAVPTTYVYTGNFFNIVIAPYTTSDRVTATVELASPLPANMSLGSVTPLAFSLSDGEQTITNLTAAGSFFTFQTGAAGEITAWVAQAFSNSGLGEIDTLFAPAGNFDGGALGFASASISGEPGTWSRVAAPDAASTLSLLFLSLTALGLAAGRFKRVGA
jgi:hypothetical protein